MSTRIVTGACLLMGVLSTTVWPGSLSAAADKPQTTWKAGAASVVITPEQPMWMAGYAARDKPSEGKVHDLNAKALALEGATKGITVNAVAPGYVSTDMVRAVPEEILKKIIATIPVGRLGDPHDIARSVLFLVADDADFITGSTLSVNGGQHMY